MKYFFILIGLALFLFACDKKGEPFAEICSNKVSYKLTDTIRVDNCSKRYTKQRWLLPDGTISYGDYAYFIPTTSGFLLLNCLFQTTNLSMISKQPKTLQLTHSLFH